MTRSLLVAVLILAPLAACGPSYSPDTYSANAAQQANKTEQGIIIGVRPVRISAAGTVGSVTGAAAGGIAGSQNGVGAVSAFSALGGSLIGGIAGSAVEHATDDTDAYEYIVKKTSGELVSVTQKDEKPLALGLKVLVIAGPQARVVMDYTDPALAQITKNKPVEPPKTAADLGKTDATPASGPAAATPVSATPTPAAPTPASATPAGAIPAPTPAGAAPATVAPANAAPTGTPPATPAPATAAPANAAPASPASANTAPANSASASASAGASKTD